MIRSTFDSSRWLKGWTGLWLVIAFFPCGSDAAAPAFKADRLTDMNAAITNAIAAKNIPGAVLWVERMGLTYHKAFGQRSLTPTNELMSEDTIFDGQRRYWPDGFPYVHECKAPLTIPNAHDFEEVPDKPKPVKKPTMPTAREIRGIEA